MATPPVSTSTVTPPAPESIASPAAKRYLPWLVAVAFFMESLDTTILNTGVPAIAAALNVSPLNMKSVLASYTLSLAVFIPISGWMADRFGTRKVFASAIGLFTLGSFLCGISTNIHALVAFRILQGCGGAMMVPVGRLTLVRTFAKSELIRTMSFVSIPGPDRADARTDRGRLDRRLPTLARDFFRQHSDRTCRAADGLYAPARLSRKECPQVRFAGPHFIRLRRSSAFLCVGSLRRTHLGHRGNPESADYFARADRRLRFARRAHCVSAFAAQPVPTPHVQFLGELAVSSRASASAAFRFCCHCSIKSAWASLQCNPAC